MYARLSSFLCLTAGKELQDTHTYLSFCHLLVRQASCFPNSLSSHSPFYPNSGGRRWRHGKKGHRNITRQMMQWEHSSKGHGQCLGECYHISLLGSCMNLMTLSLSSSIFSDFQSFLEKQKKTITLILWRLKDAILTSLCNASTCLSPTSPCRCSALHDMVKRGLAVPPQVRGMPLVTLCCSLQGSIIFSISLNWPD